MGELKRCPFCGAKPDVFVDRDGDCHIRCLRCGSSHVYDRTEKEAAKKWNRRAE